MVHRVVRHECRLRSCAEIRSLDISGPTIGLLTMSTFSVERTTYTYIYLYEASFYSLQEAKLEEEGIFFKLMGSMLFSAFCEEGYLNFLGEQKISNWTRRERKLGRAGRLSELLKILGMKPNISKRPFKTYRELFAFRDTLVHSRLTETAITGSPKSMRQRPPKPLPEWEKLITLQSAQRLFDDTTQIIRMMNKKAGYSRDPFAFPWTVQWNIKHSTKRVQPISGIRPSKKS